VTKHFRHIVRVTGGILLVLVGLVGLIMPIMPGWVFIIPGLVLLADYFPPIRRLLEWAKNKLEEQTGPHLRKWEKSPQQPGSPTEPPGEGAPPNP
jgi:uncharacterized membrane protein YbaN (DUF454 family)